MKSTADNHFDSVNILGIDIDCVSSDGLLDQLSTWIAAPDRFCRQVCTVNPEFVMHARSDPAFADILNRASLRVADGIGIVLAARLQNVSLPGRVTGSDGIYKVCERAAKEGWHVFFLGAAPGVAQRTADVLLQSYPSLFVAGTYSGSPQRRDWPLILRKLQVAKPDILLVAFGHPKQNFWIDRHQDELPTAVAIGVGGSFDFVAGVTVRAPVWMRRCGLEWLHRLVMEPWRWRRMIQLPAFALLAVRQALALRLRTK